MEDKAELQVEATVSLLRGESAVLRAVLGSPDVSYGPGSIHRGKPGGQPSIRGPGSKLNQNPLSWLEAT